MSLLTRRQALVGVSAMSGLAVTGCSNRKTYLPPSATGVFGISDTLTLASQRLLLSDQSMAREFPPDMISRHFPAINTTDPGTDNAAYRREQLAGFADWRLPVTGLVGRPLLLSLARLRAMPQHSQITQHSCERGWSAIAKWTGVRLAHVLAEAGLKPQARFIIFRTVDGWWDSLDLFDALHPQTMLAHSMNDAPLPVANGAPVRLRVERYLGWKNLKYLKSITVAERIDNLTEGSAAAGIAFGFPWYAGI